MGSTAKSSTSPVNSVKQLYPPIPVNTIPDNVVYIITSPVHRKLQTYIIGASISKEIATALRCKAKKATKQAEVVVSENEAAIDAAEAVVKTVKAKKAAKK